MKILKVKDSGFLLNLFGSKALRTPIEIDITKYDEKRILTELKRAGVTKYKIVNLDEEIQEVVKIKKKKIIIEDSTENIDNSKLMIIIENQERSIKEIKRMLEDIIDNKEFEKETIISKKKKISVEDEPEEFIPEININNMKTNIK
jgi:alpha-amylase/alpha-mannosidase (GH57 family)